MTFSASLLSPAAQESSPLMWISCCPASAPAAANLILLPTPTDAAEDTCGGTPFPPPLDEPASLSFLRSCSTCRNCAASGAHSGSLSLRLPPVLFAPPSWQAASPRRAAEAASSRRPQPASACALRSSALATRGPDALAPGCCNVRPVSHRQCRRCSRRQYMRCPHRQSKPQCPNDRLHGVLANR